MQARLFLASVQHIKVGDTVESKFYLTEQNSLVNCDHPARVVNNILHHCRSEISLIEVIKDLCSTAVSSVVVLRLIIAAKDTEMYGGEESKHIKCTH